MMRFQSRHRARHPLRVASVTRTSQLKRTVNASVYRIHQTEDGKRVKKRPTPIASPRPNNPLVGGKRVEVSTRARSGNARSLKNAFFRRDIDELTISADIG